MGMIQWLLEKPGRNYFSDVSDEGYSPGKSNPAGGKRKEVTIMNLRVGDYVTYQGVDYYVRQRYMYRAGAFEWLAYQFSDSDRKNYMWLDVEEDDELNIDMSNPIKLPENINSAYLNSKKPIEINGEKFEYDEFGRAQVRIERENYRWDNDIVEYWDYYNSDESKFLSFEKWGTDELEASLGKPIKEFELEIYPGS